MNYSARYLETIKRRSFINELRSYAQSSMHAFKIGMYIGFTGIGVYLLFLLGNVIATLIK